MSSTKTPPPSLKEINRILRPIATHRIASIPSWRALASEVTQAAQDEASGVLLLHSVEGGGKSTFMRQLLTQLADSDSCHVIHGVIAEPIKTAGWMLNFLSDALTGSQNECMRPKEVVERLDELMTDHGTIVIAIDGLELLEPQVIAQDFAAFLSLASNATANILICATFNSSKVHELSQHPQLMSHALMRREIPKLSHEDIIGILTERLSAAGLDVKDYQTKISKAALAAAPSAGRAIRVFADMISGLSPKPTLGTPNILDAAIDTDTPAKRDRRPGPKKQNPSSKNNNPTVTSYDNILSPKKNKA